MTLPPAATARTGWIGRLDAWLHAVNRRRLRRRRQAQQRAAERAWYRRQDPADPQVAAAMQARAAALGPMPALEVLMRPSNDAAAGPERVAFNSAIAAALSETIIVLPPGGVPAAHANLLIAEAVRRFPSFTLIYGDEDAIDTRGRRHSPLLRPDWNAELLRSTNYLTGLVVVRREVVLAVGGLRTGPAETAWWDLLLRLTEGAPPEQVVHIPHVLSHQRAQARDSRHQRAPAAQPADVDVVQAHLNRCAVAATARSAAEGGVHVSYAVATPAPLVSLIIPTRNGLRLLRQCVQGIVERTHYAPYEIVIVDNGSDDPDTLRYLSDLLSDPRIRVQRDDRPFNFAALNNAAVPLCRGRVLGFVNNDVEVITPNWLDELVGIAMRTDVGAVGARLWFSNATLQHAGVILGIGGVAAHLHQRLTREHPGYQGRALVAQEFSAVTAACMLMRREVFEQMGGFDEAAFAIDFNDIDLCLRIRRAGYRVIWTPHAELFHHESATRGRNHTDEQRTRHTLEFRRMRERWAPWLDHDPAYNPNASLKSLDAAFSIASEPRVSLCKPWFESAPAASVSGTPSAS